MADIDIPTTDQAYQQPDFSNSGMVDQRLSFSPEGQPSIYSLNSPAQASSPYGATGGMGTPYGSAEYDQRNDQYTDSIGANDYAGQEALRRYLLQMPGISTIDSSLPGRIADRQASAVGQRSDQFNTAIGNQRTALAGIQDKQKSFTQDYENQMRQQSAELQKVAQSGTPLSGMAVFKQMHPVGQIITSVLAGLSGKGGLESMQSTLDNLAQNNREQIKLKTDTILNQTHNLNDIFRVKAQQLDQESKYVNETYGLALDVAKNQFEKAIQPAEKLKALLAGQELQNKMSVQNAEIDMNRKKATLDMLQYGQALSLSPNRGEIMGQPVVFKQSKEADEFRAKSPKIDSMINTLKYMQDKSDFRLFGEGKKSLLLAQLADATGIKAEEFGGTLTGNAEKDVNNLLQYLTNVQQTNKRMYTLNGAQMQEYVNQMQRNIPGYKPLPMTKTKVK